MFQIRCAVLTGSGIIINEINLKKENSIAIFGLGGVGLSALMSIRLFECQTIIAVDVEDNKLRLAKEFGATKLINSTEENPVEAIIRFTENNGVDFSIEASGVTAKIEQAFQSVRARGGICIFASHPKADDKIKLNPFDLIRGRQIRGTWGGGCNPDEDIPKFAQLYREEKLPLRKLLSHSYSLDKINQALDDLEHRKIARALIRINEELY